MIGQDILKQFISGIHPLTLMEEQAFLEIWQPFSAKRKTMITRTGDTERYLYFTLEGIQRVYHFDDAEREAAIIFSYPPSFFGVADSFLLQKPSRYYAETLTPSTFLRTDFVQLDEVMKTYPDVERLIRVMTNFAFAGLLERLVEIQCFSAEEKFKALMKRSPHLLNLVPHKYIASYLGIDSTNFSKFLSRSGYKILVFTIKCVSAKPEFYFLNSIL